MFIYVEENKKINKSTIKLVSSFYFHLFYLKVGITSLKFETTVSNKYSKL